ncbi:MAG: hypothetical protein IPF79_04665 [Ignavibacteria bacterium]|nr:hypothetical protein [Ignavibacteria bacterium]
MGQFILCVVLTSLMHEGVIYGQGSFVQLTTSQLNAMSPSDVRPATESEEDHFLDGHTAVADPTAVVAVEPVASTDLTGEETEDAQGSGVDPEGQEPVGDEGEEPPTPPQE